MQKFSKIFKPASSIKSLLLFLLAVFITTTSYGRDYVHYGEKSKSFEQITFANGETLSYVQDNPKSLYGSLLGKTRDGSKIAAINLSDSIINIVAAFPDSKNAQVAIVTSNCGGTSCPFNETYALYLHKGKLHMSEIATIYNRDYRVNVEIESESLKNIGATNIWDGSRNSLGDPLMSSRTLSLGKGFVVKDFQKDFISLIGEHPEAFFSNKQLREIFAQKIGSSNFKSLRESMVVAPSSKLIDGRYIVFDGCMAHYCDVIQSALVLDGVLGNVWALQIDKNKKQFSFFGTDGLTNADADMFIFYAELRNAVEMEYEGKTLKVTKFKSKINR
jgi:hypothetical protein